MRVFVCACICRLKNQKDNAADVFNTEQHSKTPLQHPYNNSQQPLNSRSHVWLYFSFQLCNMTHWFFSASTVCTTHKRRLLLPPLHSPVAKNFFLPPLLNWRRSEGCDSDPEWRIKAFKKKKKKYQDSRLGAPHGSSVGHRASTSALEEARGNPTTSSKAYPRHDDGSFTDGCEYFFFLGMFLFCFITRCSVVLSFPLQYCL